MNLHEITDEMIERMDPNPPCPNCEHGRLDDVERPHSDGSTVEHTLCTTCWTTPDGEWFLPPRRTDMHTDDKQLSADHNRPAYRGSGKKIMDGALTAYKDTVDYGLDDGSADYEQFVTA